MLCDLSVETTRLFNYLIYFEIQNTCVFVSTERVFLSHWERVDVCVSGNQFPHIKYYYIFLTITFVILQLINLRLRERLGFSLCTKFTKNFLHVEIIIICFERLRKVQEAIRLYTRLYISDEDGEREDYEDWSG